VSLFATERQAKKIIIRTRKLRIFALKKEQVFGKHVRRNIRASNQKFPDWPPGARTANGAVLLPPGAVVSLFYESV
jgi:hypothetical protein